MNSAMRPIFNIKIAEKKMFVGLVNNARDPLVWHKATETHLKKKKADAYTFSIWFVFSNNNFQFLNNISRISIHFFTHAYFHKCFQTTIFSF